MDHNCEFSNPVKWDGSPAQNRQDFQFKNMECNASGTAMISDGTFTAYVEKKVDLGDIFIILFLTIFLSFWIFKVIWDFTHPRIFKGKSVNDL
jgi:hypothetical protein